MRVHGGGDAECANDQRDQAYQAEKCRRAIQTLRDYRMSLPEIGNQRVRKSLLQSLADVLDGGRAGCKPEQITLGGAAADADQSSSIETLAADHHTRSDVQAAGHAVGLGCDHANNVKGLAAEANRVTGPHL